MSQSKVLPIQEFLAAIFHGLDADHEAIYTGNLFEHLSISKLDRSKRSPQYFLTSTVTPARKLQRKASQVERMHCLVLDDVCAKVEPNDLEPSWIIESSEGSFQWGYIFAESIASGEGAQLLAKISAVDPAISDNGALTSPARLVRLPRGINGKKMANGKKNPFIVRLVEWHPDRHFDVSDFESAWSLPEWESIPGKPAEGGWTWKNPPMSAAGINEMHILRHFDVKEVVDGKAFVTCPNEAEHTTPSKLKDTCLLIDDQGRWAFNCLHGHCSAGRFDFAAWYRAYAFNALPIPPEGSVPVLRTAIGGLAPGALAGAEAMAARTIYLTTGNGEFFDTVRKERIKAGAFDGEYKHHFPKVKSMPPMSASGYICAMEDKRVARGIAWSPEDADIIRFDGQKMANTYRPPSLVPAEGDVSEWLALLQHIYGEHWELVRDHMAFTLQKPLVKIRWQILTHGAPRTGKSLTMEPLKHILGSSCSVVDHETTKASWGDMYLRKKMLIIEEVHAPGDKDFFNSMKAKFANNDIESLNVKTKGVEYQKNLYSMYMFSNYSDAVAMDENDDKLLVIEAPSEKWPDARYYALGQALEHDASYQAACFHHLLNVDLSAFNPNQLPVRTEALLEMVNANRPMYEQFLAAAAVNEGVHLVDNPLHDRLFSTVEVAKFLKANQFQGFGDRGVSAALVRIGFVKCVGQKFGATPLKYRFWAKPAVVQGMSSRQLYDIYDPIARCKMPKLELVKDGEKIVKFEDDV